MEVESVLGFLKNNGFAAAAAALAEDLKERSGEKTEEVVVVDDSLFDFAMFLFPMMPPPPPVRVTSRVEDNNGGGADCCSRSSLDEFVSLGSSSSVVCSSEFTNPYGERSSTGKDSKTSSDNLSAFDTARGCRDFDLQDDLHLYDEKDDGNFMTPCFNGSDPFGFSVEDKFVMTLEAEKFYADPLGSTNSHYLNKPCLIITTPSAEYVKKGAKTDDDQTGDNDKHKNGVDWELHGCAIYGSLASPCKCETRGIYAQDLATRKEFDSNNIRSKLVVESPFKHYPAREQDIKRSANEHTKIRSGSNLVCLKLQSLDEKENLQLNRCDAYDVTDEKVDADSHKPEADENAEDGVVSDEVLAFNSHEEEYEVFDLRIIHRKNRTGFEENKEIPIAMNSIIAGRYYVTEYLGSAAFSRVVQAHDLHTGIDVCLKIIKNDKDFFDQSLDEIKLLKFVNKHDPADEHHILRLYDYFYHQEHLFIVCELLRANLYECQKFNQDSGEEMYFGLSRLRSIARQCLEALEYLHHLGIIHCDLKPENILIKGYERCEIKIIDLGSSCFQTDNLCLYVQSRSYRAPEVILGLPYDNKIDIWSLGCILGELCSGEVLFPNDALVTILARMIGMLGPIDVDLLLTGQDTDKYFTNEYDLYQINEETNQLEYVLLEETTLEHHLQCSDTDFIEFVKYLLEMNPERRPTATEALQHPWLSYSYDFNFH